MHEKGESYQGRSSCRWREELTWARPWSCSLTEAEAEAAECVNGSPECLWRKGVCSCLPTEKTASGSGDGKRRV